jgi:sterol desaturase/sphingolipid hydroxylase (fatty acid hydroxylase superfamily)
MRDGASLDRLWQKVLAVTVVPLAVVVCVTIALALMEAGWSPPTTVLPIGLGMLIVVATLERILPWNRDWLHSKGDLRVDALYIPTQAGVGALLAPVAAALVVALGGALTRVVPGGLWPDTWPILAQVILASVVREFFDYWAHRAMHAYEPLWRLHATHHSAPRLYWLNGARAHPGEIAFRFGLVGVVPLAALGADVKVIALTAVAALAADSFQHANIALRLGPLSWIYSIGDAHRWHHSRTREEADSNYGNVYLFWDAIFGTRYLPSDREPPAQVGIDGLDAFPTRFFEQWLSPFRWSRILRASAGSAAGEGERGASLSPLPTSGPRA